MKKTKEEVLVDLNHAKMMLKKFTKMVTELDDDEVDATVILILCEEDAGQVMAGISGRGDNIATTLGAAFAKRELGVDVLMMAEIYARDNQK